MRSLFGVAAIPSGLLALIVHSGSCGGKTESPLGTTFASEPGHEDDLITEPDGGEGTVRIAILGPDTPAGPAGLFACRDRLDEATADPVVIELTAPQPALASVPVPYDLLVLCTGWMQDASLAGPILQQADAFAAYLEAGGALLMLQPNPLTTPLQRVNLLPAWFEVENRYTDSASEIVADHAVTRGFSDTDMPYPADRITAMAPAWRVLARGVQSGDASLMVLELGSGRAAVDADSEGCYSDGKCAASYHHSTELIERLLLWLRRRID